MWAMIIQAFFIPTEARTRLPKDLKDNYAGSGLLDQRSTILLLMQPAMMTLVILVGSGI
jgi:hypothetical protein